MSNVSNESLPIAYGDIPEDIIERCIEAAEEKPIYPKITPEGFEVNGQVVESVKGKIVHIQDYWCKWENKKPERVYRKEKPSEDHTKRCEMVLITIDNFELHFDLPVSSYNNLCQFVKHCHTMQRNVAEVPVMLTTHEAEGQFGNFVVVKFKVWTPPDDIPF